MPSRLGKWLVLAAVAAFLGSILVSMWNDLIAPPLAAGDTATLVRHVAAMVMAFGGLALVVGGGWWTVSGTRRAVRAPEAERRLDVIRFDASAEARGAARRAHVRAQGSAAWRGLALMLLGLLCFVAMNHLIDR